MQLASWPFSIPLANMKGTKFDFFGAQAAHDSADFPVILAGLGAFRSDEPNVLVGGDRPNEGDRRLNSRARK
jgi:hypothetical protein